LTPENGGSLEDFYLIEYQGEGDVLYPEYNKTIVAVFNGIEAAMIIPPLAANNYPSLETYLEGSIKLDYGHYEILGELPYPIQDQINEIPRSIPITGSVIHNSTGVIPVQRIQFVTPFDLYSHYEYGTLYIEITPHDAYSPGSIGAVVIGNGQPGQMA